jgi:MFS family permease
MMTGPILGGYLLARGRDWNQSASLAYGASAVCALAFGAIILSLRLKRPDSSGQAVDRSLLAGFRFIWHTRSLMGTILLDLFAVLLGGVKYLMPVIAVDILRVGEVGYTMLFAGEAMGAFCMTLLIAHMPPMRRAGRNMMLAVAGFGLAAVVFGLSRSFWLSFSMLVIMGALDSISVIVRHTLVQVLTPDSMRGRVSAVNNVSIGASNELGGVRAALVAAAIGTVPAILLGGLGSIATVVVVATVFPQILRIGSLQDVRPGELLKR